MCAEPFGRVEHMTSALAKNRIVVAADSTAIDELPGVFVRG